MGRFVAGADRSQMTFLPECLDDWVGADNPVQVIEAFVGALDLPALGFSGAIAKAKRTSIEAAFAEAQAALGEIDIVIANAGVSTMARAVDPRMRSGISTSPSTRAASFSPIKSRRVISSKNAAGA